MRYGPVDSGAPAVRLMTYGTAEMSELLQILRTYWEATSPKTAIPTDIATLEALEDRFAND